MEKEERKGEDDGGEVWEEGEIGVGGRGLIRAHQPPVPHPQLPGVFTS